MSGNSGDQSVVNQSSSVECNTSREVSDTDICEINKLNEYCLRYIFSQLSIEDKLVTSKVCRSWQAVISTMLYKTTELAISCCFDRESHILDKVNILLQLVAGNIKKINFKHLNFDGTISLVARPCMNLEIIHLESIHFNTCSLVHVSNEFSQLKEIKFSAGCTGLTDRVLSYLFNNIFSQLEVISFSEISEFKGTFLHIIRCPLKSMSFNVCKKLLPIHLIEGMKRLKDTLTSITVKHCHEIADLDCNLISGITPKLKRLCLVFDGYKSPPVRGLENFKELQVLDLPYNTAINDCVINSIVDGCKDLKILKIGRYGGIRRKPVTENGIAELGKLKNLEEIDISGWEGVSDRSLTIFSELSPSSKIKKFICSGCAYLGDTGAVRVLYSCVELELFDVSNSLITETTLKEAINVVTERQCKLPLTLIISDTMYDELELEEYSHPLLYLGSYTCPARKNEIVDHLTKVCCSSYLVEECLKDYNILSQRR